MISGNIDFNTQKIEINKLKKKISKDANYLDVFDFGKLPEKYALDITDLNDEIQEGVIYVVEDIRIYKISPKIITQQAMGTPKQRKNIIEDIKKYTEVYESLSQYFGKDYYTFWIPELFFTFYDRNEWGLTYNKNNLMPLSNIFCVEDYDNRYVSAIRRVLNKIDKNENDWKSAGICLGRSLNGMDSQYHNSLVDVLQRINPAVNMFLSSQGNTDLDLHQRILTCNRSIRNMHVLYSYLTYITDITNNYDEYSEKVNTALNNGNIMNNSVSNELEKIVLKEVLGEDINLNTINRIFQ